MDTMEEEVGSMRRSVGEKAEHLRERMSSSDLMESILEFARSNGGAIASGVGRTVREHPVPIVMIGAGIAWLAISSRRRDDDRSEEHTSELQSLMRTSYAVFCLKKKK